MELNIVRSRELKDTFAVPTLLLGANKAVRFSISQLALDAFLAFVVV